MDHTEEIVALKKAYADMILNTTKEASVRVMAAESKARKFEIELASTKQDAIRMLLRLKHMIDTQKKEAEIKSLNDQKRINEIEAQLDEAEGIILDLRAKQCHVEDKLESMKDKYKRSLSSREISYLSNHNKTPMDTQSYVVFPYSLSVPEPTPVIPVAPISLPAYDCITSEEYTAIPISGCDPGKVFPSDIVESKEPELYNNECCQAFQESDTMKPSTCDYECITSSKEIMKSSSGCHSGSVNSSVSASATIERNELYTKEIVQKNVAIETCLPEDKSHTAEETRCFPNSDPKPKKKKSLSCLRIFKSGMKDSFRNDITTKDQPVNFCKLRRRTIRYGRVKAGSSNRKTAKNVNPQRTSVVFTRCKSSLSDNNARKSYDTPKIASTLQSQNYDAVSIVPRSLRSKKTKHRDTTLQEQEASCLNDINLVECQVIACQDEVKTREGIHVKVTSVDADNSMYGGNSLEDDVNLIDVVITEQPNFNNTCTVSESIQSHFEPNTNRTIIHTFSRKRKKRSLVQHDESNLSEECSLKNRVLKEMTLS